MERILIKECLNKIGEIVKVSGWVANIRDHGSLIFVELRDFSGKLQIVINSEDKEVFEKAKELGNEYVVSLTGNVISRDEKLVNKNIETGTIELQGKTLEILNESKTPPFPLSDDGREIDENMRLKYRYIDIRRKRVRDLMLNRNKFLTYTRNWFNTSDFTEIETPLMTVSTPEGARDFLVPSRIFPGKFFALPQSPQQYKQLLMVGGVHRYFQVAPCFRDEDPRADRHSGAFYQVDAECSFMESDEQFFKIVEPYFKDVVEGLTEKKIKEYPFPRIKYMDAWNIYGTDKPDLRYDMKLTDLTDIAKRSTMSIFASVETVKAILVPKEFSRMEIDEWTEKIKQQGAKGLAWIKISKSTFDGGVSKFFDEKLQQEIRTQLESTGYIFSDEIQTLFIVAGDWMSTCKQIGWLRTKMGDLLNLKDPNLMAYAWIVDFDMFEWNETENRWDFMHNPFSMPRGGLEALRTKKPNEITAQQYDIACNGYELASGSIRNHHPETFIEAFKVCGYTEEETREKFGHMISAFEFGAPPHGGFAFGVDRLMMILFDEENIREVYAFPQTGGQELMMNSPREVSKKDLGILHLESTERGFYLSQDIESQLNTSEVAFKVLEHEEVHTSEESAKVRGTKLSAGMKAMILKSSEYNNKYIMTVIPADKQIDLESLSQALNEKYIVAPSEEVESIFGIKVGAVPPFGRLLKLDLFFDKSIYEKDEVAFNIGLRTKSVIMKASDLISVAQPDKRSIGLTIAK